MESKTFLVFFILFVLIVAGTLVYQRVYLPSKLDVGKQEAQVSPNKDVEKPEKPKEQEGIQEPVVESPEQDLIVETLQQGSGIEAKNNDKVEVHYTGMLEDGFQFDSSLGRGEPFAFTLGAGQVIKGWDLGVLGMKAGEKRKLTIPSHLAYGPAGVPGRIPPNSVLIFEVEMIKIYPAQK